MTGTSFYICPVVFSGLHVSSMFVCRKLVLNTNHVQATGSCWQWHLFRLRIIALWLLYRVTWSIKIYSFRGYDSCKMCVIYGIIIPSFLAFWCVMKRNYCSPSINHWSAESLKGFFDLKIEIAGNHSSLWAYITRDTWGPLKLKLVWN